MEEIEQKIRLTFKDETDHEEESMVEEKKQASNSSTAIKVVFYVVYVYFDDTGTSLLIEITRSRACKWAGNVFSRTGTSTTFIIAFYDDL